MPDLFVPKTTKTTPPTPVATPAPAAASAPVTTTPVSFFSAFCHFPDGVTFSSQEPDEHIHLLLRRHFITNIGWMLMTIILLIVPYLLFILFSYLPLPVFTFPTRFITVLTLFYYLIVAGYTFISFITWFYNISIVTQKRVVDLDFSDILYKNLAATKIELIEDVDATQTGAIRTFFDYGDVTVQTAGAVDKFDFEAVPHPNKVVNIVEDLIGEKRNAT